MIVIRNYSDKDIRAMNDVKLAIAFNMLTMRAFMSVISVVGTYDYEQRLLQRIVSELEERELI